MDRDLTVADHTAVVDFCLRHASRLTRDPPDSAPVLLTRAAALARGRQAEVLTLAAALVAVAPVGPDNGLDDDDDEHGPVEGLRVGLNVAADLLSDGEFTIYRPGYWHEEGMLVALRTAARPSKLRRAVGELARAGAVAAIEGGRRAAARGGSADATAGALVAAVAASAPTAVRLVAG